MVVAAPGQGFFIYLFWFHFNLLFGFHFTCHCYLTLILCWLFYFEIISLICDFYFIFIFFCRLIGLKIIYKMLENLCGSSRPPYNTTSFQKIMRLPVLISFFFFCSIDKWLFCCCFFFAYFLLFFIWSHIACTSLVN